jgi:flotillin
VLGIVSRFLYICRPNQLLVISGRRRRTEDGSLVGYRVVTGGWALRLPDH